MATIVAIAGSVRSKSYNQMLLRAAIELAPKRVAVTAASIAEIPLYNGDVEEAGVPAAVTALKDIIAGADGVLLVTPEYNNSIPGVFKNAIDWTTRPSADMARVWGGRKVGMIGASPGPWGTSLSQAAWLPVLRTIGSQPYFGGRLQVAHANTVFDEHGALTDAKVRGQLEKYMAGFVEFVAGK